MAKYRALFIAGIGAVAIGGIVIVATEVIRITGVGRRQLTCGRIDLEPAVSLNGVFGCQTAAVWLAAGLVRGDLTA